MRQADDVWGFRPLPDEFLMTASRDHAQAGGGVSLPDLQPMVLGGKCQVPMWMNGTPAGLCGEPSNGPQLPKTYLAHSRAWPDAPYCFGPCCPKHGGPRDGDPIIFQDGYTPEGRPMWCAVEPGFINLQESHAGFSGNPVEAVRGLERALADTTDRPSRSGRTSS